MLQGLDIEEDDLKELLELTRSSIQRDLGSLRDLPYELANTVANIYYKDWSINFFKSDIMYKLTPTPIGKNQKQFSKSMADFLDYLYDKDSLKKQIIELRKISKTSKLYNYAADLLIDKYKYKITNAINKPKLLSKIQRILFRNRVNEVPNLINMLGLY